MFRREVGRHTEMLVGAGDLHSFHKVRICIVDELKFFGCFSLGEACLFWLVFVGVVDSRELPEAHSDFSFCGFQAQSQAFE